MGPELIYLQGQTPLDEDEKDGLLIKTISTRSELDEMEQLNIQHAVEWTLRRRFTKAQVLSESFINGLHKRMFNQVWRWAGTFRKTDKNIGVDKHHIPVALRQLIDDCKFWIDGQLFSPDEIAIRFKHRIVTIHCYPNGNGRHARLMADVIISHLLGGKVFSWGGANLVNEGEARTQYLRAMREGDAGNFQPLIHFARS